MYRNEFVKEVESNVNLKKCNECLTDLEYLNGTLGHIAHDMTYIKPVQKTINAAILHVFKELQKVRANLLTALQEAN